MVEKSSISSILAVMLASAFFGAAGCRTVPSASAPDDAVAAGIGETEADEDLKNLMMLSEAGDGRRDVLQIVNMNPGQGLDLGFSYYGSKDFTRVFYRTISDQKPFLEAGIPSVMFTSGITLRNNKPDDTPDTLDYGVLRRRVLVMFHYLVRII